MTKFDGYTATILPGYEERLKVVNKASLQISHIEDTDGDWYQCSIVINNGKEDSPVNDSWIHLTVHSKFPCVSSRLHNSWIYLSVLPCSLCLLLPQQHLDIPDCTL
ncbi:hypothetical protein BsWGS_17464 [Bradybaena similaris]